MQPVTWGGGGCGACAPGYALSSPYKCIKCGSVAATVLHWIAPGGPLLVLLLVAGIAIPLAMAANKTPPKQLVGGSLGQSRPSPGQVSKLLALFLQYVAILGSLPLPWPEMLLNLFNSAEWLFGSTPGQVSAYSPFECLLRGVGVPSAVLKLLVQLCTQATRMLVHLVVFSCIYFIRNKKAGHPILSKQLRQPVYVPVVLLVCAFLTFPGWVRTVFSFFACQNVQDPTLPHSLWWAHDMNHACYRGYHKAWSLGLGIPCLILCCLAPVLLFGGLVWNRAKLSQPSFKARYGSVYELYCAQAFYWEAVIWVQTILLVAVSVFATQIGIYTAVLLCGLHLVTSLVLLQYFRPFYASLLHHTHVAAHCCLLLNIFVALLMFAQPPGPSQEHSPGVAQTAAACVALAASCAFVVACVMVMVRCFLHSSAWAYLRKQVLKKHTAGKSGEEGVLPTQ